jgi:hypothetical protein
MKKTLAAFMSMFLFLTVLYVPVIAQEELPESENTGEISTELAEENTKEETIVTGEETTVTEETTVIKEETTVTGEETTVTEKTPEEDGNENLSVPSQEETDADENVEKEDAANEVPSNDDILTENYFGSDFTGFGMKLENVWAGYTKTDNIIHILLTGKDSLVTIYSDAIIDGTELSSGWNITGKIISELEEESLLLEDETVLNRNSGEFWLTVGDDGVVHNVSLSEFAENPDEDYVVFSV